MTAEIAILNKTGLALAADSALTVQVAGRTEKEQKLITRFTANKVFALSKLAPVGVMVYGKPEVMGIPWETVVKLYRTRLGRKRFVQLKEYAEDFLKFLGGLPIPSRVEAQYVLQGGADIFPQIRKQLDSYVRSVIKDKGEVPQLAVQAKLTEIIRAMGKGFVDAVKDSGYTDQERERIAAKYGEQILGIAGRVFERIPLTSEDASVLRNVVVAAACVGKSRQSGVVIAGFGEDELYPSFFDYNVAGILLGKAVNKLELSEAVSDAYPAMVKAFAQAEDVALFIEGIGSSIGEFLDASLRVMLQATLPERLAQAVKEELKADDGAVDRLRRIAEEIGKGAYEKTLNELNEVKQREYIDPVLKATMFLQKGELGIMAETLVNLVSFRKQVTLAEETVGGPIDVAVITKGDGLVWIKRKHYFRPGLNPRFFRDYLEHGDEDAR